MQVKDLLSQEQGRVGSDMTKTREDSWIPLQKVSSADENKMQESFGSSAPEAIIHTNDWLAMPGQDITTSISCVGGSLNTEREEQ